MTFQPSDETKAASYAKGDCQREVALALSKLQKYARNHGDRALLALVISLDQAFKEDAAADRAFLESFVKDLP